MLERLLNRLAGKGEAVIRKGDQEIVVLGLSKDDGTIYPIRFFHTKSSKKIHLDSDGDERTDLYGLCGRWFEGVTTVKVIPNGRDYWKASGSRVQWAKQQVPGAEFCQGCFFERE